LEDDIYSFMEFVTSMNERSCVNSSTAQSGIASRKSTIHIESKLYNIYFTHLLSSQRDLKVGRKGLLRFQNNDVIVMCRNIPDFSSMVKFLTSRCIALRDNLALRAQRSLTPFIIWLIMTEGSPKEAFIHGMILNIISRRIHLELSSSRHYQLGVDLQTTLRFGRVWEWLHTST